MLEMNFDWPISLFFFIKLTTFFLILLPPQQTKIACLCLFSETFHRNVRKCSFNHDWSIYIDFIVVSFRFIWIHLILEQQFNTIEMSSNRVDTIRISHVFPLHHRTACLSIHALMVLIVLSTNDWITIGMS